MYPHMPGLRPRGGIEIIEVAETRGSPEISTVMTITSLDDAARFSPTRAFGPIPKALPRAWTFQIAAPAPS